MKFGSLGPDAKRPLTDKEIRWSWAESATDEAELAAATARTRGFASARVPATLAAQQLSLMGHWRTPPPFADPTLALNPRLQMHWHAKVIN